MCRATVNSQANYEKAVFAKTSRTNARQEGATLAQAVPGRALMHLPDALGCADTSPVRLLFYMFCTHS
jgi:hypothetical protein